MAFTPREHGMCDLYAHLPADAVAIRDQIHRCAEQAKGRGGSDDTRTADQRRADTLIDLILDPTGATNTDNGAGAAKTTVNVTVALSTLLGLDEQGAELGGHGPIPATLVRALAFDPNGTWRRLLTDDTGHLLAALLSTKKSGPVPSRPRG